MRPTFEQFSKGGTKLYDVITKLYDVIKELSSVPLRLFCKMQTRDANSQALQSSSNSLRVYKLSSSSSVLILRVQVRVQKFLPSLCQVKDTFKTRSSLFEFRDVCFSSSILTKKTEFSEFKFEFADFLKHNLIFLLS